ncbi:MAG: glycosyltransferase family 2 protein [Planctomycetia bacterium]|nr:glycosyltransferase family 2 protein [Planctomycetia bacterium]
MTDADVTVIVVTHDSVEHVARCLACLAEQTRSPRRILVRDTDSHDGTIAAVEAATAADPRLRDRVELGRLGENVGFAAANNRAIASADTPLVALLNPDAFPEPEWLERLVAAAAAHPACAAFGSRQMLADHPDVLDGIGDRYHLGGLAWRQGHGRPIRPGDLAEREIFSVCAAAALYRRAAIVAIGGFDEDFFCYGEDVDLGFRLRLAGHHAWYVPDAVVHHVCGASSKGDPGLATALGHRNLVWTLVKNMPGPLLAASLPAHFLQTILAAVMLACRGQTAVFARAKLEAIRGLPNAWRKRRQVQASRVASAASIWQAIDKGLVRIN